MEEPISNRATLIAYARLFGVDISPDDESLERSVQEFIGFLDDMAALDLSEVAPAAIYDPAWSRVNEVRR